MVRTEMYLVPYRKLIKVYDHPVLLPKDTIVEYNDKEYKVTLLYFNVNKNTIIIEIQL